jgi:hypothetical protein
MSDSVRCRIAREAPFFLCLSDSEFGIHGKIERLGFIQAVFIVTKRTVSHARDAPPFHSAPVLPGCRTEDDYLHGH